MKRETAKRLHDAQSACLEIETFTSGHTLESMRQSRELQLVLMQLLQIVGEALNQARKTEPESVATIPNLRLIVDMRNRLIHGYDSVDEGVVRFVATEDIPELRATLDALLDRAPPLKDR